MKTNRDQLLVTAFKLFMSVNYEKASFAELGKMLGMTKSGIFKYYEQVYMGLSFEMAFSGGLDTRLLSKHLHAVYSLLKS